MLGYHQLERSRLDTIYTENLAHAHTGGVYQALFSYMVGCGGCTAETINSPFSLSSLRDYICDVTYAEAVIKELKFCCQLQRLT